MSERRSFVFQNATILSEHLNTDTKVANFCDYTTHISIFEAVTLDTMRARVELLSRV